MKRSSLFVLPAIVIASAILWLLLSKSPQNDPAEKVRPAPPHEPTSKSLPSHPPTLPQMKLKGEGGLRVQVFVEDLPAEGVVITLLSDERPEKPRTITTRKDGAQEMLGMPEGAYSAFVQHLGYVPQGARAAVRPGETAGIVFHLKRGAEIAGTVRDPEGRPIEAAGIRLLNPGSQEQVLAPLATETRADGRYRISGVPSGIYLLDVRHPLYRPRTKDEVAIRSPDDRPLIDVVLARGSTLAGRVVDGASRPIAGAHVLAMNEETSTTRTGSDGHFSLAGLGDRALTVRAEAEGYGIVFLQNVAPGAKDIEMRLLPAATIAGRVSADPLPPAFAVKLWKYEAALGKELGQQYYTRFGEDGAFFVPNLGPGDYRMEIEAPGYEAIDRPVLALRPGTALAEITIRMRRIP